MKTCVFAGTFDPITVGHENLINKCLKKYDLVFVVVGDNPQKQTLFSNEERVNLVKETFEGKQAVIVFDYLRLKDNYVDFLKEKGVKFYVRGIRNKVDKKFENQMKKVNKTIYPFIKTKYFKCAKKYSNVSSTFVKKLIFDKKDYLDFIPQKIQKTVIKLLAEKTK